MRETKTRGRRYARRPRLFAPHARSTRALDASLLDNVGLSRPRILARIRRASVARPRGPVPAFEARGSFRPGRIPGRSLHDLNDAFFCFAIRGLRHRTPSLTAIGACAPIRCAGGDLRGMGDDAFLDMSALAITGLVYVAVNPPRWPCIGITLAEARIAFAAFRTRCRFVRTSECKRRSTCRQSDDGGRRRKPGAHRQENGQTGAPGRIGTRLPA